MIDYTNKKSGRLTGVKIDHVNKTGHAYWIFRCDCGNEKAINADNVKRGRATSCGCYVRQKITKHGMSRTRFYAIWNSIKGRCLNDNNEFYYNYGGRGIKIAKEWETFDNFKNDMYDEYLLHEKKYGKNDTTIERINTDGAYCVKNCTWATRKEQQNNRRCNVVINYGGESRTMQQWNEKLGFEKSDVLGRRINLLGWNIEKAMSTPILSKDINKRKKQQNEQHNYKNA